MTYLAPLFKNQNGKDIPSTVEFSHEEFLKYRGLWKTLWRTLGRYDGNGTWVPPVSFAEARELPQGMLIVFQELDYFFEQMKKQYNDKKKKSNGAK